MYIALCNASWFHDLIRIKIAHPHTTQGVIKANFWLITQRQKMYDLLPPPHFPPPSTLFDVRYNFRVTFPLIKQ